MGLEEDIAQKLGLFNIQSISYCILGLTFESYVNVVSTKYGYPELTQKQAEDFGFNRSNPYNREWVILESIWLDEIQNRMEALNDANG